MSYDHYIDTAAARATGSIDLWTTAYVTEGGTWVLAADPKGTDDGRPHDLVAVLPAVLDQMGTRVLVLRPTVNPALVAALRAGLDPTSLEKATMTNVDPETLGTLADAARKWRDELDGYIVPSAEETSEEDAAGYRAESETITGALEGVAPKQHRRED